MKETGLIFKAPLVRAILEGRKTQTRRVAKEFAGRKDLDSILRRFPKQSGCPYGEPGDCIYVRESFVQGYEEDPITGRLKQWDDEGNSIPMKTWFRATDTGLTWSDYDGGEMNVPWKPAIHMTKELARIWLEITDVRVERIQEIAPDDCIAEGAWPVEQRELGRGHEAVSAFRELWESTGGDWDANPWVWAIDFKVLSTTGRPA